MLYIHWFGDISTLFSNCLSLLLKVVFLKNVHRAESHWVSEQIRHMLFWFQTKNHVLELFYSMVSNLLKTRAPVKNLLQWFCLTQMAEILWDISSFTEVPKYHKVFKRYKTTKGVETSLGELVGSMLFHANLTLHGLLSQA